MARWYLILASFLTDPALNEGHEYVSWDACHQAGLEWAWRMVAYEMRNGIEGTNVFECTTAPPAGAVSVGPESPPSGPISARR